MINDRQEPIKPPTTGPISSAPFNILVVDNDVGNRKSAQFILTKKAFPHATVTLLNDGSEFLAKLKDGTRYDFVILDDLMDVVNGSIAIVLWRMLELKKVANKTESHKIEFQELREKFKFLKEDFEKQLQKQKNDQEVTEKEKEKNTVLMAVYNEMSELSVELEEGFKNVVEKAPTGDQNPRQIILAWSSTAEGHSNGYTGADVRLGKPMSVICFHEPKVLEVIRTLEKKKLATVEDINAPSADVQEESEAAPKAQTSVSNQGLFKDGKQAELAEPTQAPSEPKKSEGLSH